MSIDKLQKQLQEAKEDLAALKNMKASPDEIEFAQGEVDEIEAKIKNAPASEKKVEPVKKGAVTVRSSSRTPEVKKVVKPVSTSKTSSPDKKAEASRIMRGGKKAMVKKSVPARIERKPVRVERKPVRVERKPIERKPVVVAKKALVKKKSKGLSVVFDGKTYLDTDPNFCEILIKQLEERKNKRKETGGKVKTSSLSAKVGDNIASSVVTAIKGAFKENRDEILENKTSANKFLKVVVRIEAAADRFVKDMKSILADNFKQKDFDKEFKEVDEVIKKIKETIKKSVE
jgi:hypothetical protein